MNGSPTSEAAEVLGSPVIPDRPPVSRFAMAGTVGALLLTWLTAAAVDFSFAELVENLARRNLVVEGLLRPDITQLWSERSRTAFVETLQLAVIGTATGGLASLPLALWATDYGNPNVVLRTLVRTFNNVVRSMPDLLWALLFVTAVGIGALPGMLALFFFSIAVVSKLTADTLDGVDRGPIEAAQASGAGLTAMLRTAVVPQILPAYTSFLLYGFELNLRASAVLGLVGAGGIGARIEFFRGRGEWSEVWGLVLMFFAVVFLVERLSVSLRRRLV